MKRRNIPVFANPIPASTASILRFKILYIYAKIYTATQLDRRTTGPLKQEHNFNINISSA